MFWDYDKAKIRFLQYRIEIIKAFALVGTRHKNSPRQSKTVKDSPKSLDNPWFTAKMKMINKLVTFFD